MIDLYAANSSNSQRVAIMLEECAIPYTVHAVDLAGGEQRSDAFLATNPAGAVPVIVDSDAPGGSLTLAQSGAILLYLAMVVRVRYGLVERAGDLAHLVRWAEGLAARPAVVRAIAACA
jgi:glutathione S-transferase